MKNLLILLMLLPAFALHAQNDKLDTLVVRTSAVCDMCVTTIESEMIYEKGVKKVTVDLAAVTVTVQYDPRKTNPDALRKGVTKLGYYADDLAGDPKAFANLPACCQKEGCGLPAGSPKAPVE